MKKTKLIIILLLTFIFEVTLATYLFKKIDSIKQDTIKINECVNQIEENYHIKYNSCRSMDYTLLDENNKFFYKTVNASSKSINEAIKNNDIILDLIVDEKVIGKILIKNNTTYLIKQYKSSILYSIIITVFIQLLIIIIYIYKLDKSIIKPFKKLNSFAERVAGGNLDIPLDMDRAHLFGEFTEAFDIMRSELKKARVAEKEANDAKKELVAKLSHDLKTPVASIKSTSEIGYEYTKDEKTKNYFNQINIKTDQIKLLVDNLFNSSINDIKEIDVNPSNYNSSILKDLIINSDYLNKLNNIEIPDCNIYIDKVRMQQVFDNIINNSYKYANTKIDTEVLENDDYLEISFRDYGNGVDEIELPILTEKYKRGKNVKDKDGAGLGLYITKYFMDKMNGELKLENTNPGFKVIISIKKI